MNCYTVPILPSPRPSDHTHITVICVTVHCCTLDNFIEHYITDKCAAIHCHTFDSSLTTPTGPHLNLCLTTLWPQSAHYNAATLVQRRNCSLPILANFLKNISTTKFTNLLLLVAEFSNDTPALESERSFYQLTYHRSVPTANTLGSRELCCK